MLKIAEEYGAHGKIAKLFGDSTMHTLYVLPYTITLAPCSATFYTGAQCSSPQREAPEGNLTDLSGEHAI